MTENSAVPPSWPAAEPADAGVGAQFGYTQPSTTGTSPEATSADTAPETPDAPEPSTAGASDSDFSAPDAPASDVDLPHPPYGPPQQQAQQPYGYAPEQPIYQQQPDAQYGYAPHSQHGFTPPAGAPAPGYGPGPVDAPAPQQPPTYMPQGGPPQGYAPQPQAPAGPARGGWRRSLQNLASGFVSFGGTRKKDEVAQLAARVRQPIRNDFRLAVLSLKGGVGKTTVTIGLGSALASLRGDRVIAVDANPDLGTLARRIPAQTASTVRDLLQDPHLERYMDVRKHTSQAPSRLEVLASERDPAISEAFSEDEYLRVIGILQNHYNMILTDCGTGLVHSAMAGVMKLSTSLVLVTSPALDGAQSAVATLDWLVAHGYDQLAREAVVVIAASKSKNSPVDITMLRDYFLGRTRAVQIIPYDEHLAIGGFIDLDEMAPATRSAFLELAATLVEPFAIQMPPPGYSSPFGGMPPQGPPPGMPQGPPQGPPMQ